MASTMSTTSASANQSVEITLHWLDQSRSQRIAWMLEELALPYKLKIYKRGPDRLAPPSLKAIHPLGKSPVLEIKRASAEKSVILAESGNMVEYLAEFLGKQLIPGRWKKGEEGMIGGETEEWLRYRYFMHYAEGSFMPLNVIHIFIDGIRNAPVPFFIKPITRGIAGKVDSLFLNDNFENTFNFLESQLKSSSSIISTSTSANSEGGPFFCGPNLTAVDFLMPFPLEAAQGFKRLTREKYPLLTGYVQRIQSRPAYKRAVQRIIDETGSYDAGV